AIMLMVCTLTGASFAAEEESEEAKELSVVNSRVDELLEAVADELPGADAVETYVEQIYEESPVQMQGNENPLTGLDDLDPQAVGKRPVAVMINNHKDNYPQYNIGKADVIFEVVVEHDLTRFMALFADYQNIPYLVSVRSYRYYFPAISEAFDAFYIHWGEDQTMMWYYEELGLDSYDGLSNDYIFGRDQERMDNGYGAEHASCLYGDRLPLQIAEDGKRTDIDPEYAGPAFNFVPFGTVNVPDGNDCSFAYIDYRNQTTQLTYDPETGKYMKWALEEPQIDGISGEQLSFENVLILYTDIQDRDEDEQEKAANRKWVQVLGQPTDAHTTGYYLSEGKAQPIRWAKDDEWDNFRFYDLNGEEIMLNRGKTYITITYLDSAQLYDTIPQEYIR
ncbi:MAG: DUF3048 domain-containing protein, partial [Parasporobacterium sp.]|nr:DUF3048 domain-containing protein [Parasporobacterium sp.]